MKRWDGSYRFHGTFAASTVDEARAIGAQFLMQAVPEPSVIWLVLGAIVSYGAAWLVRCQ